MGGKHGQREEKTGDKKDKSEKEEKTHTQKRKERSQSAHGDTPEDKISRKLSYDDEDHDGDDGVDNDSGASGASGTQGTQCMDSSITASSSVLQRVEDALKKMREGMVDLGKIGKLDDKITDLIASLAYVSKTVEDLTKDVREVKKDLHQHEHLKVELDSVKRQNKVLKEKMNDMENYSRRDNLEITGIDEHRGESVRDICVDLFKNKVGITEDIEIVRCHRTGKSDDSQGVNSHRRQYKQNGSRPILVRFRFYSDKEKILKKRARLKGTGIYLNDDLSFESKRKRSNLVPILKRVREIDNKAHFRGDRIFFKGRLYGENNIHDLPVDAHNTCTKSSDGVTIFCGKFSKLSNLHQHSLTMDGRTWHSVEQYVQYNKAMSVGDREKAAMIVSTDDPQEAMHLGNSINTEHSAWSDNAAEVIEAALLVKFQEPAYKLALQSTEDVIGESTQHKVWGTGLSMGHQQAFDPRRWTGKNMMGKLLSKVKVQTKS